MSYYRQLPFDVRLALWLTDKFGYQAWFVRTLYRRYRIERQLADYAALFSHPD